MRRFLSVGLIVLASGLAAGCSDTIAKFKETVAAAVNVYDKVTTASVTPQQIEVLATAFDGLKSVTTSYFVYCKKTPGASICAPGTKQSPGPLRITIACVKSGTKARNALEPYILQGGAGPGTVFNTLVDSVNCLNGQPIRQAS